MRFYNCTKLKNDEALFKESMEKLNKAIQLGSSSYNLACLYAVRKDVKNALTFLEMALEKKKIDVAFVEKDDDWKGLRRMMSLRV